MNYPTCSKLEVKNCLDMTAEMHLSTARRLQLGKIAVVVE